MDRDRDRDRDKDMDRHRDQDTDTDRDMDTDMDTDRDTDPERDIVMSPSSQLKNQCRSPTVTSQYRMPTVRCNLVPYSGLTLQLDTVG